MRALLCVSDFPYTEPTVRFGGIVTEALLSDVTLLSVRSDSEKEKRGEEVLKQASGLISADMIKTKTRRGPAGNEIMDELDSDDYDVLIIGARDHPSTGELLLGFVARRLVKQAQTSVLVIRQPPSRVKHILVCTAGPSASKSTVRVGAQLAQATGAYTTLLHVAAAVPSMYSGLSRLGEGLPELLQTGTPIARHLKWCAECLKSHDVDARLELRHGLPSEQILRATQVDDYDLIVIGGSSHRGLNRMLLDEVSLQIVGNAPRPVLVVRSDLTKHALT